MSEDKIKQYEQTVIERFSGWDDVRVETGDDKKDAVAVELGKICHDRLVRICGELAYACHLGGMVNFMIFETINGMASDDFVRKTGTLELAFLPFEEASWDMLSEMRQADDDCDVDDLDVSILIRLWGKKAVRMSMAFDPIADHIVQNDSGHRMATLLSTLVLHGRRRFPFALDGRFHGFCAEVFNTLLKNEHSADANRLVFPRRAMFRFLLNILEGERAGEGGRKDKLGMVAENELAGCLTELRKVVGDDNYYDYCVGLIVILEDWSRYQVALAGLVAKGLSVAKAA